MTAHSSVYAKYPAMQSERTLALLWMLIATLAVAATFSGPSPFLPEGSGAGARYFSDHMRLLALVSLGLARFAVLSTPTTENTR
jgi:hypothetical protein